MLVCVRKGDVVKRVPRAEAEALVAKGWRYTPKSAWRKFQAK